MHKWVIVLVYTSQSVKHYSFKNNVIKQATYVQLILEEYGMNKRCIYC